ncbi:TonB family protein [Halosquirtibacter laminarini]|uniref:TonB family protein n=1 Tax=Halosquirtibacter laminarini TaxID=3374600 RepID=A0AC61NLA9_9BACT|nr:TonB family protein [Prolixibacteraceae bacterium]
MKQIILYIFILMSLSGYANRVYLNSDFKKTTKAKASYYRDIETENKIFVIKDFSITGIKLREGLFKDKSAKIKHGKIKEYYSWGNIAYISHYENNSLQGKRQSYYATGELKREEEFQHGELISGKCFNKDGTETPFFPSLKMPTFDSNNESLSAFINRNIYYPTEAYQLGKEGRVLVSFKVDSDGKVSNIKILKSSNILFNKEAKEIIRKTNKRWQSGLYENIPSAITMTIPIDFTLN